MPNEKLDGLIMDLEELRDAGHTAEVRCPRCNGALDFRNVADGLVLRRGDGSLQVTPLGRLFVRNVAMLFDAYLPEQRRSGRRIFSKTV